jgi:quercetin dioxygenase-like cupin family protein
MQIHPGVFASELHRYGPGGGAALFRLEAGARMPEHTHPSGEHGYVIEGTGVFGDQTLSAGDAFWMDVDDRHHIHAITELVFLAASLPRS